jgi:hypothetical protein
VSAERQLGRAVWWVGTLARLLSATGSFLVWVSSTLGRAGADSSGIAAAIASCGPDQGGARSAASPSMPWEDQAVGAMLGSSHGCDVVIKPSIRCEDQALEPCWAQAIGASED